MAQHQESRMPVANWAAAPGTVSHVHEQASRYLQSQLSTATAADQRAITAASIFVATAVAIVGIGANSQEWPAQIAGALAAASMVVASAFCALAARPRDFYFVGNEPTSWWASEHNDLEESLANEVQVFQEMIDDNAKALSASGRLMRYGMVCALCAPLLGVAAWAVATFS